jgi:proteasome lid subunit RPN8/RPN11
MVSEKLCRCAAFSCAPVSTRTRVEKQVPTPTIKIKKSQLDYFRHLARDSAKEIQAMLIGEVLNPDLVKIVRIVYPKKYEEQTYSSVCWDSEEYKACAEKAAREGFRIVGHIHSHPNWDAVLSENDHQIHLEEGYRVSGLCSTQGRKTRIRFWLAESSLPCKVEDI